MKHVLLICTGNVCRTPMALGILRQRIAQAGLDDQIEVSSAGVFGLDGSPASGPGVEVMADRGIDISDHVAHTVTQQDVAQADLVLVMEEGHRRSLFYDHPQYLAKVFLLSEMSGDYGDVEDPYRRPKAEYERCADRLTLLIDQGFPNILRRLEVSSDCQPAHSACFDRTGQLMDT